MCERRQGCLPRGMGGRNMIYCPALLASQDLFICLRPLEQFLSLVCLADEMDGDHLSCRSERFHSCHYKKCCTTVMNIFTSCMPFAIRLKSDRSLPEKCFNHRARKHRKAQAFFVMPLKLFPPPYYKIFTYKGKSSTFYGKVKGKSKIDKKRGSYTDKKENQISPQI